MPEAHFDLYDNLIKPQAATMCKERYVSPFTDFGFKLLFGSEQAKQYLISFLNSLLELEDKICDIKYENPEKIGPTPEDRRAVFDLYCTTEGNRHFIVEMQNANQRHFVDRSIYYSTFPMTDAAKRGDWDFRLPTIYLVAFLNFRMPQYADNPDFKHVVKLMDENTGNVFYDKLTYIYLEMPKFDRKIGELRDFSEKWLYVIKHMNELDEYPEEIQEEIFRGFFRMAEISAMDQERRMAYEQSLKSMRDYSNTINYAREEGLEEGLAQGREEGLAQGREEERLEVARKLKTLGMPTEVISKSTGLSTEDIANL